LIFTLKKFLGFYREGHRIKPDGARFWIIAILAVPMTLFELWLAFRGAIQPLTIAMIFVSVLYTVTFLTVTSGAKIKRITWFDYFLALTSFVCCTFLLAQTPRYVDWISGISEFTRADLTAAVVVLLLTLELLRRCVGFGLSMMVYSLLVYVFLGHLLNGTFSHRQLDIPFFAEEMIISANGGLFGVPIQVAATYAFLFILFGKFIETTGGGKFFFDAAAAIAGRRKGGVAKVAVVSSALFGTISGSPAADVMTTGSVTIPAMKKLGYSARFAGAVESVASTGGSLLPPVMGAVIFLMAEFTGIKYLDIAKSAVFIAFLYYFSVYFQVHLRADSLNLKGLPDDHILGIRQTLKEGWHTIIPFGALVYFLVEGYTPAYVAAAAVITTILVSWLRPGLRVTPISFVRVAVATVFSLAALVAAVAAAGIVIGGLNITGLAGKLASLIFLVSGGNTLPTLFIAAAATILLGMGMPVVAAYAMAAILIAPALVELGIPLLQSHLFLVYYSVLSAVTPPIAIACYVASSIANARPMEIAMESLKLAQVAFIIPFMFIYNPGLLLEGGLLDVLQAVVTATIGVYFFCIGLQGWLSGHLHPWARGILILAGLLTIAPSLLTDLLGLLTGGIFIAMRRSSLVAVSFE